MFERDHPEARVVRVRPAFVFQRGAATAQRRLFAGPFVPGSLVRPSLLPVLPLPAGLRFQAVHADDLADALRRCALDDVRVRSTSPPTPWSTAVPWPSSSVPATSPCPVCWCER